MTDEGVAALVERGDPERWRTAMAAPPKARPGLMALYAFNLEIARAPWVASEPGLAAIRLRWWHDAVAEIYDGQAARLHHLVPPRRLSLVDLRHRVVPPAQPNRRQPRLRRHPRRPRDLQIERIERHQPRPRARRRRHRRPPPLGIAALDQRRDGGVGHGATTKKA